MTSNYLESICDDCGYPQSQCKCVADELLTPEEIPVERMAKDTVREIVDILKENYFSLHKAQGGDKHKPNLEYIKFLAEKIIALFDEEGIKNELTFELGEVARQATIEAVEKARHEERERIFKDIDNLGLIEHTGSSLHEIGATIIDCPACVWYAYKALKERK